MATQLGLISPLPFSKSGIFSFHNQQIFQDIPGRNIIAPKIETFHDDLEEKEKNLQEKLEGISQPDPSVDEANDSNINTGDCVKKEADIPTEKAMGYDSESSTFDVQETLNDTREENDLNGEISADSSISSQQGSSALNYNADEYIEVSENVVTDEDGKKIFLYECKICKKCYRSRDSARKHMHGHYGFKPFKCQQCDKAFVEKKVLQIHMRTHTGEKPYSCTLCDKSFSQSIQLLRHKRMHSGNTPYKCDICGKVFSQRFCVERHRKVHVHPKIRRYQNLAFDAEEFKSVEDRENINVDACSTLRSLLENHSVQSALSTRVHLGQSGSELRSCSPGESEADEDNASRTPEGEKMTDPQKTTLDDYTCVKGTSNSGSTKRKHSAVDEPAIISPKGILLKRYKEESRLSSNEKSEDSEVESGNLVLVEKSEAMSVDINGVSKLKRRKQNHPQKKLKQVSNVSIPEESKSNPALTETTSDSPITDSANDRQSKFTNSGLNGLNLSNENSQHVKESIFKYLSGNSRVDNSGYRETSGVIDMSNNSCSERKNTSHVTHTREDDQKFHSENANTKDIKLTENSVLPNIYDENSLKNATKTNSVNSKRDASPGLLSSELPVSLKNHPLHSLFKMKPLNCANDSKHKVDISPRESSIPLAFSVSNTSLPFTSNHLYSQNHLLNPFYPFPGISAQNLRFMNPSVHKADYLSNVNKENSFQSQALDLSKKSSDRQEKCTEGISMLNKTNLSSSDSPLKVDIDDSPIPQKRSGETTTETITCDICNKHYRSKENLRKHMKKHEGSKPHKCDQCGKAFLDKKVLEIHYRRHTGEKPYRCDDCDVGYAQSVQLLRHMRRVHTKDFPFRCDYCHKGFSCNFTLKRHVRIHTGEKPFICELCGEAFAYDTSYKVHIMRHSGEQPHECFCGKKFLQKSRLILHQESHSPSELTNLRHSLGGAVEDSEVLNSAIENYKKSITDFSQQFCTSANVTSSKLLGLRDDTDIVNNDCDDQKGNECNLHSIS